jgi:glycosyltransferase involved in cell wall biosynthesis
VIPALRHQALSAAFDRFPSRKGSAVHIDRFARALFEQAGGGLLYVLGGDGLPAYQREGGVEVVRCMRGAEHVLERAAGYRARLAALLDRLSPSLRLAHFRDPWSGVPIVEHPDRSYVAAYEVNGLPSVELPFLYPALPPAILERVAMLEQREGMGRAARARVTEHLSWDASVTRLRELYSAHGAPGAGAQGPGGAGHGGDAADRVALRRRSACHRRPARAAGPAAPRP